MTACIALTVAVSCACTALPAASRLHSSAGPAPRSKSSDRAVAGAETLSLARWATVRVPRRWIVTPFAGVPATVYFPLDFVSSDPLPRVCRRGGRTGIAFSTLPGHRVTIDHRPAKLYSGPATDTCPAGTATEIDAFVPAAGQLYPGERIDMHACLGASAAPADRAGVLGMLASLRIRP